MKNFKIVLSLRVLAKDSKGNPCDGFYIRQEDSITVYANSEKEARNLCGYCSNDIVSVTQQF